MKPSCSYLKLEKTIFEFSIFRIFGTSVVSPISPQQIFGFHGICGSMIDMCFRDGMPHARQSVMIIIRIQALIE